MESPSNLTIILLFVALGIILLAGLFVLALKTKRIVGAAMRDCPQCKRSVEATATECGFCLRKVVYVYE